MDLQKIESPNAWVRLNNFKGRFISSIDELDVKERGSIILPFDKKLFYVLYDIYERTGKEYTIYPILNRTYWVVQTEEVKECQKKKRLKKSEKK